MNKIISIFITIIFIYACGDDGKLEEGSPFYELAQELSQKVPELNPDSNIVWISTDDFTLHPSEIIPMMQERYGNRISRLKEESPAKMHQSILSLSRIIARNKILLKAAKEQNITYSQAKLDSLMEIQINRWGGPDRFKENFEKDGMNVEAIRETIKEGLIIEEYMNHAVPESSLAISDEDIMLYYKNKSVAVRHILLLTQGKSEEEKRDVYKKMEEILKETREGKDFAQLATTYSEDPGSKSNGGFYEFGPGRMVPEFEYASFSTPIGEISDIVETEYGYHIIKVIDRKPETRPFEEIRALYESRMLRMKRQQKRNEYIEALKEQANYKEYVS